MKTIAVVIADDHPLVRQAVKHTFRNKKEIQFLGEADNGIELLGLMEKRVPDIAIVDLEMPQMNGYDTIYELHTLYPDIKIIAFSGFLNAANQKRAIEMGACATISKTETSGDFIKALEAVIQGENYHTDVSSSYYADPPGEKKDVVLTLREKQVLSLVVQGKTSKQIGEAYNISQWTVDKHRSNIRTKLGHKSLAETVRYAIERGYIDSEKE
ncbi:MAG: response regulator transcription factor [Desulfobacterales bacterium]|nr:response regulator transcription factor [Desulfobacterales bacterium]